MTLVADISLVAGTLPLTAVAEAAPDIRLTIENTRQNGGPVVIFLRARGDSFEQVDAALDRIDVVQSSSLVRDGETDRLYQVLYVPSDGIDLEQVTLSKAMIERVEVRPDGWLVRAVISDHEELISVRDAVVENGIEFRLERLTEGDGEARPAGLTGGQHEALLTALEMGYFEIPRRATLGEVATALGVSAPSLSERLRRAQRGLIEHYAATT